MRTTITFDEDVAAAIEHRRRDSKLGISEVVNDLIRRGLRGDEQRAPVRLKTNRLNLRFDVSNVAEALDVAEGTERR